MGIDVWFHSQHIRAFFTFCDVIMRFLLIASVVAAVILVGDARSMKSAKREEVARTLMKITSLMREQAAQRTEEATGETLATNEWLQHEGVLFEEDEAEHGGNQTTEETYEVTGLELAMCGEFGVGGAFWAAYQHQPDEDLFCPPVDDSIWGFVLSQPNVVCLMPPQTLRNGFECVRKYYEENPITYLYHLMQVITASLPHDVQPQGPAPGQGPALAPGQGPEEPSITDTKFSVAALRLLKQTMKGYYGKK